MSAETTAMRARVPKLRAEAAAANSAAFAADQAHQTALFEYQLDRTPAKRQAAKSARLKSEAARKRSALATRELKSLRIRLRKRGVAA